MAQHISADKESDKVSPQHMTRPAISGRTSRPLATLQNIANRSMAVQRVSALQDMANARYTSTQLKSEKEEDVRQDKTAQDSAPVQRRENSQTGNGLPPGLKSGIENLSGISMGDVTVQRNSSEPAKVGAHAFAQGTNIHLGPRQDKHLPHEAWHVVQQKQGRVKPTMQMKGVVINDDVGLEREADVMGARAMQKMTAMNPLRNEAVKPALIHQPEKEGAVYQRKVNVVQRMSYKEAKDLKSINYTWRDYAEYHEDRDGRPYVKFIGYRNGKDNSYYNIQVSAHQKDDGTYYWTVRWANEGSRNRNPPKWIKDDLESWADNDIALGKG